MVCFVYVNTGATLHYFLSLFSILQVRNESAGDRSVPLLSAPNMHYLCLSKSNLVLSHLVAPTYGQDQIRVRGNLNLCKLSIYESLHWLSSHLVRSFHTCSVSLYRQSYSSYSSAMPEYRGRDLVDE